MTLQIVYESIKKSTQSVFGDHSLILLSIYMEKYISFKYQNTIGNGQISSFKDLGNRHLNYIMDSAVVMYYL